MKELKQILFDKIKDFAEKEHTHSSSTLINLQNLLNDFSYDVMTRTNGHLNPRFKAKIEGPSVSVECLNSSAYTIMSAPLGTATWGEGKYTIDI